MCASFSSVTSTKCTCGFLDREAADPDSPIAFDPDLNEFHFCLLSPAGGEIQMMIYHCPFCGGVTPESVRASLFASVPVAEEQRIRNLLGEPTTLEQAIAILGPPDHDNPAGITEGEPEANGEAPRVQSYRCLEYWALSEFADVRLTDYLTGRVHVTLSGKYIGKQALGKSVPKRMSRMSREGKHCRQLRIRRGTALYFRFKVYRGKSEK